MPSERDEPFAAVLERSGEDTAGLPGAEGMAEGKWE